MPLTRARSLFAFACALAASSPVQAHAPARVMQFLSAKPEDVVLATNRGIIYGNLMTRDFKILCNAAYGVSPAEETVRVARTPSGRLLVASSDGLQLSDDKGCTWQPAEGLDEVLTTAMAQHPSDPTQIYFATYSSGEAPHTASLRVTTDGGDTNSTLLSLGDEFLNGIAVAPTTPAQIYMVGITLGPMAAAEFVARSVDGGKTWERHPIALEMMERNAKLLAVNPVKPEEILIRATGPEPSQAQRLLYSADGGKTITSLGSVVGLDSAAFARDGAVAYVAGLDGVQRVTGPSERKLEAPTSSARISQVFELEGELLAAGYYQGIEAGKDGVGIGPTSSLSFEPWMAFTEVDEELKCSAEVEKKCKALWLDWQIENPPASGRPGASDGGTTVADAATILDAGTDAGLGRKDASGDDDDEDEEQDEDEASAGGSAASSDGGCSCSTTSLTGSLREGGFWLLALAFLSRRRRPSVH